MSTGAMMFTFHAENNDYVNGFATKPPQTWRGCGTLFLIPFILVGFFLIAFLAYEGYTFFSLSTNRQETWGNLIERTVEEDEDGTRYSVRYEYFIDGIRYENKDSVSAELYQTVNNGEPLKVYYALNDYDVSTLSLPTPELLVFLTVFTTFWNGVIWIGFYFELRERTLWKDLFANGQRIKGTITKVETWSDSDDDLHITVHYEFRATDGITRLEGKESTVRNDLKRTPLPSVGENIMILYKTPKHFRAL